MKTYLQIAIGDDDLVYLVEGTGKEVPESEKENIAEYWNGWEEMETKEILFKRIKELIYKIVM